jgi:hypothetical protein
VRIENLSPVLPVPDVDSAARVWAALLGVAPRFVDGERWAQFDVDGRRLALAGTDRMSDRAGVMIKVDDLAEARRRVLAAGLTADATMEGPHELRFTAAGPGGWPITFYAPKT